MEMKSIVRSAKAFEATDDCMLLHFMDSHGNKEDGVLSSRTDQTTPLDY